VTEKDGVTTFKARHDIGKRGTTSASEARHRQARHDIGKRGTFNAEGTITPTEFHATYKAAGDHGVFVLKRPS
jgi:hypothetical protein